MSINRETLYNLSIKCHRISNFLVLGYILLFLRDKRENEHNTQTPTTVIAYVGLDNFLFSSRVVNFFL